MKLVDAHCHLESGRFIGKLDGIIADAREAGIIRLITSSIVPAQWETSRSIASRYPDVEFTMGVHPWYIEESFMADLPSLSAAKRLGAVAIGEIGLDRKIERGDFSLQVLFFEEQLSIAKEIGLPVVIHCRGAFNELILSLKRVGTPEAGGIVHSFSGSEEIAEKLMGLGLSFSMGGVLTYRNSRKRAAVLKKIYPGHFLLETDSPDIPPVEKRGEVNLPRNILYNLRGAADSIGDDIETIAKHTTENASRLFSLDIR